MSFRKELNSTKDSALHTLKTAIHILTGASLLFSITIVSQAFAFNPLTPVQGDYLKVPPALSGDEKPSTTIILDSSGSMCERAHETGNSRNATTSPSTFNPLQVYSGYFDPLKYYDYNTANSRFEIGPSATADWSGNWLNWMTTRRMDGAKQALIGGQVFSTIPGDVVYASNYNCGSYADDVYSRFDNSNHPADINGLSRSHTPYPGDKRYRVLEAGNTHSLAVRNYDSGSWTNIGVIRVLADPTTYDLATGPTGIIQNNSDKIRFGIAEFEGNSNGGIVVQPVGSATSVIVNAIDNIDATTATPLAETLHSIIGYYQQTNTNIGGRGPRYTTGSYSINNTWDPFYFSVEKPAVPCSELNILLITDGQPTADSNIPTWLRTQGSASGWDITGNTNQFLDNVAYWGHTTDLRTDADLPGIQRMNLYTIMAFGNGLGILRNAAINGSWVEKTVDGRPNTLAEECAANESNKEWDFNGDNVCTAGSQVAHPANYIVAQDSNALAAALDKAFSNILKRVSVGSASSLAPASRLGDGTAYQATFIPHLQSADGLTEVSWVGDVHAFFTDESGNLRVDTNQNGILDCDADKVAVVFYGLKDGNNASLVRLFTDANGNCKLDKGEDIDQDGRFDVNEDRNNNQSLDLVEIDLDGDGVVDPIEDFDGDGHFDLINEDSDGDGFFDIDETIAGNDVDGDGSIINNVEDLDGDGHFDIGEDIDGDGHLDVNEDANGNGIFDASETLNFTEEYLMFADFLWSGHKTLSDIPLTDLPPQRDYPTWDGKRYIFTGFDDNGDGFISNNETYDFTYDPANALSISNVPEIRRYFRVEDLNGDSLLDPGEDLNNDSILEWPGMDFETLVNYTRGVPFAGLRNRQITLQNGVATISFNWILGDIINSPPIDISTTGENFDLLYKDNTYRLFAKKYLKRRHVIYTGANDGMLHAFNGGFYDRVHKQYWNNYTRETNTDTNGNGVIDGDFNNSGPKLGAELWAYIPYNTLPHLAWLAETDYDHMPFIDAPVRVADVKIFAEEAACHTGGSFTPNDPNCIHPSGWGTILIAGMGFGGGPISVDSDADGLITSNDKILSSSYSIFDITDPENKPVLLKEFSFQSDIFSSNDTTNEFSFTTSFPTIIQMKRRDLGTDEIDWYIAFGSGPQTLDAESNQNGKIYILALGYDNAGVKFDVASGTPLGTWVNNGTNKFFDEINVPKSFISDLMSADFEVGRDEKAFMDDAAYFGTVAGDFINGWTGDLRRIVIDNETDPGNWHQMLLANVTKPIVSAPGISIDEEKNIWVYTGTGRYYDVDDSLDDSSIDLFMGVMEPVTAGTRTWAEVSMTDLQDVTQAEVFENSTSSAATVTGVTGVSNFEELLLSINNTTPGAYRGWKRNFTEDPAFTPFDTERNITRSLVFEDIVFFTTYIPNNTACSSDGRGNLYGLYYLTGTAYFKSLFGLDNTKTDGSGKEKVRERFEETFIGKLSAPVVAPPKKGEPTKLLVQSSTSEVHEIKAETPGQSYSRKIYWKTE